MAYLELRDVCKTYGCGEHRSTVFEHLRLAVAEGECAAVLAEPGSGKSTLLSLVAGLTLPDFGSITLAGRPIVGPGPDRLFLAHNCALLPWLSVMDNLTTSVEGTGVSGSKDAARRQAEKLLDAAGLTSLAHKKPSELSPGLRKRVALARTLAMSPDVLLLDDPFAGLDAATRTALQTETARMLAAEKKTCLLATDDPTEALLLADRIWLLSPGPRAVLSEPIRVDLAKPRDRRSLQQQARFTELRKQLTQQLRTLREPRVPAETNLSTWPQFSRAVAASA
jgi:nitrate/nitrite transport system ATP-binding protein